MAELIPWWNQLPQAPAPFDPARMISAQTMAQKLQLQKQEMQGYNALGALYGNPQNVDANGNLKPEALSQLMSLAPTVGLDVQSHQIQNAQRQAQVGVAAAKVRDEHAGWLVDTVAAPAVAKYDEVMKSTGSQQQAQAAAQEVYSTGLSQAKADGRLAPQESQALSPQFDYTRARTNVLGRQGLQNQENRAQDFTLQVDAGKSPPVQYRVYKDGHTTDVVGNPYTPTGVASEPKAEGTLYTGTGADGKSVTVRMGPTGGWQDVETNKPISGLKDIRKVGTKAETDADNIKPTGPEDLHGDEYLKAVPSSRASLIKGYADGRIAFPGSFSLRSPYWQKMVADITQYDPSFDAVNYSSRSATRKDFTSGKSAQAITSFNTAIGHLGTLDKAADALNNTSFPPANRIANAYKGATGDPRIVRFNTAKQAVADELTRAFRGTGGNVSDIKGWEESLSAANSPAQLHEAVKQAVDLLRSRIEAVGQQYRRGMGTTADVMDLLTPSARKTLASLPGGEDLTGDKANMQVGGTKGTPDQAAQPDKSGQQPGKVDSQSATPPADKLKEGVETTFANGQTWVLRNGKPERVH